MRGSFDFGTSPQARSCAQDDAVIVGWTSSERSGESLPATGAADQSCHNRDVSKAESSAPIQRKPRFPWVSLLLLVVGIYVFWILPAQMGPRHVNVQFEAPKSTR